MYRIDPFLVPLGAAVWVLRARVEADEAGLVVCNGLGTARVAWDEVRGFTVPGRGPVRLHRLTGRTLLLTTVDRRSLAKVLEAAPQ